MSRGDGNVLWGWQSQEPDGRWSLIAMFAATLEESATLTPQQLRERVPELAVLIHRDPAVARRLRVMALAHSLRFGQPVRFARFDLGVVVEEVQGRE
jgi:hypothetical protein